MHSACLSNILQTNLSLQFHFDEVNLLNLTSKFLCFAQVSAGSKTVLAVGPGMIFFLLLNLFSCYLSATWYRRFSACILN